MNCSLRFFETSSASLSLLNTNSYESMYTGSRDSCSDDFRRLDGGSRQRRRCRGRLGKRVFGPGLSGVCGPSLGSVSQVDPSPHHSGSSKASAILRRFVSKLVQLKFGSLTFFLHTPCFTTCVGSPAAAFNIACAFLDVWDMVIDTIFQVIVSLVNLEIGSSA